MGPVGTTLLFLDTKLSSPSWVFTRLRKKTAYVKCIFHYHLCGRLCFPNDCNNISPIHLVFSKVTLVLLPQRTVICVPHPLETEWGLVPILTNRVPCKRCYVTSSLGLYKDTHPRVFLLLGCEFCGTEPAKNQHPSPNKWMMSFWRLPDPSLTPSADPRHRTTERSCSHWALSKLLTHRIPGWFGHEVLGWLFTQT